MNILADRHHSGLWHSLVLMARRYGWTLYTQAGHEWWDRWYWSFGRSTYDDDRLAQQYLMHHPEIDAEFPDDEIRGVTLDEALEMDWTFVIATLQDNQNGMKKFADKVGAQFIVQVGNTGQYVDWQNDPLALVSSEVSIDGRGIVYHQPMDRIDFAPPTNIRSIASFVNLMPQMGPCWDLLQEAQRTTPVAVYGAQGADGIIKPFSRLVELMGTYGWGWHDKGQGDGFGHVLHSWAAVGRPLIGHARHYNGRMGRVYWRDMETCIDLDVHSVEDALAIVATISPEDHAAMCHAMRAEYEKIDWEGEAIQIADFLGLAVPA